MRRRRKGEYFRQRPDAPPPVVVDVQTRAKFNECDVMGIVWFGNYLRYFEEGSAAVARRCGLSYLDFFDAGLRPPVIESHVDYQNSIFLDEEFTIRTIMRYSEAAVIEKEYQIIKSDGSIAASGYTVQLLIDKDGRHVTVSPPLLMECRRRWVAGEFHSNL